MLYRLAHRLLGTVVLDPRDSQHGTPVACYVHDLTPEHAVEDTPPTALQFLRRDFCHAYRTARLSRARLRVCRTHFPKGLVDGGLRPRECRTAKDTVVVPRNDCSARYGSGMGRGEHPPTTNSRLMHPGWRGGLFVLRRQGGHLAGRAGLLAAQPQAAGLLCLPPRLHGATLIPARPCTHPSTSYPSDTRSVL